jgi:uncharacterized protein (DUF58 family)
MDTSEILAGVRRIEIRTRRIVDELTAGAYHSVFKGRGIEFDEVREYQAGDDVRAIDWNVTARTAQPYIKTFVEERELTVLMLVDISASGDVGTMQRKHRQAAELAALLAFNATRNNDRVGLLLFSDRDELHLPPRKGRRHVLRLIRELLACQRASPRTNIRLALETAMQVSPRRTVIFLISDFISTDYAQAMAIANCRHDLVALRVRDPGEQRFATAGYVAVEDAETGEQLTVRPGSRRWRAAFADAAAAQAADADAICRRSGVDLIDIVNGEDYVQPLMQFFRTRSRRH